MRSILLAALTLVATGVAVGCAPKIATPLDEIAKLPSLDKVMDNQSTAMDPLFAKIGSGKFSDADLAAMDAAGKRVQATSTKIKDFTKGPEFDAFALKLNGLAKQLETAAAAKDQAGSETALKEMKATCKACHSKFR